ncbi:uncharacterized protein C8orf58 homolog isoform 3-T3 [Morphnus guianensis]
MVGASRPAMPPHAAGTNARSWGSLESSRGGGENRPCGPCCVLGGPAPSWSGVQGEQPLLQPPAGSGRGLRVLPTAAWEEETWGPGAGPCFWGAATTRSRRTSIPGSGQGLWEPSGEGSPGRGAVTPHGLGHGWSCCGVARGAGRGGGPMPECAGVASTLSCLCPRAPPHPTPPGLPRPADGPWETAESCVVHTSASVYRRLQESPRQPPGGMNAWGPPPPPPISPGSPPASGRLLKSESEDSGVEMASNDHSPPTPLGSESSFSLDGFPPEKNPPGEEPGTDPPRPSRSRSASKKLVQAAQRSRRQRGPGRCPRQFGRRSANAADLQAEPAWDPREPEEPNVEDPEGSAVPEMVLPVPGQGLRYLEHVCQMLERLARLQQDNRILRQQAADARRTRPDTTPTREPPGQDLAVWRGERFRPRSCSDSQAPGERGGIWGWWGRAWSDPHTGFVPLHAAPDPGPCRRMWGYSASSPSLLDPSESGVGTPTPDKDGRSHWGRVKVLLTRLTRRSLRGGRCR